MKNSMNQVNADKRPLHKTEELPRQLLYPSCANSCLRKKIIAIDFLSVVTIRKAFQLYSYQVQPFVIVLIL